MSGDPTGIWQIYAFPAAGTHEVFDFPHAAIGSDALYVSGNVFHNASFVNVRIYAYPKTEMYLGLPAAPVFVDVTTNAAGNTADTLTPARNVTLASTAYFISADNGSCPCSNVSLWKWADPFGASSFTLQGGVDVTTYDQPPNALQPGAGAGMITTNDAGNLASYWYNGTVYGATPSRSIRVAGTVSGRAVVPAGRQQSKRCDSNGHPIVHCSTHLLSSHIRHNAQSSQQDAAYQNSWIAPSVGHLDAQA